MARLLGSRAVSPELWWFAFSADIDIAIDIASAQDRLKYSFVGANQVMLHALQVFLGDTANSVFVKTSPATEQLYTTTISDLLDSQGETVDDIIAELLPDVLPAYPPTGIISLSADGEGWGAKLRASTEYWSKLIGINGIVGARLSALVIGLDLIADNQEYPFTQDARDPNCFWLETSSIAAGIHDLRVIYEEGFDTALLALQPFSSRSEVIDFVIEDAAGENRGVNPSEKVRIKRKVDDILPVKGADFWLRPIIKATGGPSGIDDRWFAIEAENFLGRWVEADETLPLPDGAWSDDLQDVISEGVQAYIDSRAVYGKGGKLPPEQINPASTKPRVRGVDCSGFVFNILDRALKKLKPETGGMEELWRKESPQRKRQFPDVSNPYSHDCWGIGLGTDPNLWNYVDEEHHDNPKIGDLQPGDILHYNWGDYAGIDGHYEIVEDIEENPDGTKNVVIAHSNGSLGPHRYRIENASGDGRLKGVTESHFKDEEGNQAPHNEYVTLQRMKNVKRLKEFDEREEHA